VRAHLCGGGFSRGGVVGYPLERVYEEVAYLGRRVHWTLEELLGLDHAERRRWVDEVMRSEASK
jgi:hypothetical protein